VSCIGLPNGPLGGLDDLRRSDTDLYRAFRRELLARGSYGPPQTCAATCAPRTTTRMSTAPIGHPRY
jgi:hypothetical protein